MRFTLLILTIILIFSTACDKENELTKEEELQIMNEMYEEIQVISNSKPCNNSENWTFTAIRTKACGGPSSYIAYSLNIDTASFLKKVKEYTIYEDNFNKKWSVFSDCSITPIPIGVECRNGKAYLYY